MTLVYRCSGGESAKPRSASLFQWRKSGDVVVRSKFYMSEFRRDVVRHFAGKYRHHLKKTPSGYRIALQRVDLVNGEGTFDYVILTWV